MTEENRESQTAVRRLAALVGHSAEYSIAVALLLVCLIVGVAVWLLQPSAPQVSTQNGPVSQTSTSRAADAKSADEQAALGAWKQRLEGGFDQMDQQQRRTEEERARREEQRQEEEAAARARARAQQSIAASAAPKASQPISIAPPKIAAPKPQLLHVDAAIDWSSCKRPVYPDISMRKNEQGVVTVDIDLDVNARVLRSRISQSSGFERLDTAAQRAIEKCRFRAATEDGVPQESTAVVRFTWALQGK